MAESFILGLSSGSACLVTCGMVMFPYLMAESAGTRRIVADLSVFLLTRLIIYIILATLAWYFGQAIFSSAGVKNYLPGILYIVFAGMLIWYSIGRNPRKECPARIVTVIDNTKFVPVLLGIVNSLGLCPALLIMLTSGATQDSLVKSYIAFIAFFAGSSIWFIPLTLAGKLRKKQIIATIGVLATGLAGAIFLIKGITILIGGIINE
ncbi:MAG: sulfite exporter TauE/SafE family protein [Bacteroidales bacterium]|nr:sulfite exporter TauE/SafE family protein [Bacteroidales bacterium]